MSHRVAETILANACVESRKYFIRQNSRFCSCLPFYWRICGSNVQKFERTFMKYFFNLIILDLSLFSEEGNVLFTFSFLTARGLNLPL